MYWLFLIGLLFLPLGTQATLPSWCPLDQTAPVVEAAAARPQVEVDGDRLIYRDATGQEATVLKSRDLMQAQLSDDGQWIAFTRWENYRPASLWVLNLSNSETQLMISAEQLTAMRNDQGDIMNVGLGNWRWIPKSRRIIFNTALYYPSDMVPDFIPDDLWQVNIATGSVERLLEIGQGGLFSVSPDGQYIVVVNGNAITLILVDSSTIQTNILPDFHVQSFGEVWMYPQLRWLPGGETVLVAVNTGTDVIPSSESEATIWQVDVTDATGYVVNVFDATASELIFSPDNRFVIYRQRNDAFTNYWKLVISEVESGETFELASGDELQLFGWEPDSRHFRYGYSRQSSLIGDICGA